MPKVKYSFTVEIDYQEDTGNIYVQMVNNWTGEILADGNATASERQATLNCLDYMLREHLPKCEK